MGVTAYLFDANRRIRRVLPDMTELLHTESDGTLEAVLPQTAGASPGEELGFTCVDGLFRLFTIDSVSTTTTTARPSSPRRMRRAPNCRTALC